MVLIRTRPKERDFTMSPRAHRAVAGFSLVEVLLASALLLVVVVSIMPLFSRALQSNAIGGQASAMATFSMEDLEEGNQATVDHAEWKLGGSGGTMVDDALVFAKEYWSGAAEDQLGDGGWQPDNSSGDLFLWERSAKVRKHSYADVLPGNLEVSGSGLTQVGHPELYDVPFPNETGAKGKNLHILEIRVTIQPYTGLPLSQGQQMTVGHYRAF